MPAIGELDTQGCWAPPVARCTARPTSLNVSKRPSPGRWIVCASALVYGLLLGLSMYSAHEPVSWWQPELLLLAAPGVGLVVGGASAFKVAQLASGGQAVALMMGGEEVPGTTTDARQKRLLNVVEEMALAAGVPVPPVFVLQEPGINAFAAGYAPGDSVVAVSLGCLN